MNKGTWDIIHAQYITSAVRADQYPTPPLIEAAFIGRSNAVSYTHLTLPTN